MAQLCLWTKIRTRFGWVGFSMYACGSSVPHMRQFCLFTYPPRSRWCLSEKIIFFPKSTSSVSGSQAHLAKRKRIGFYMALYQGFYTKFVSIKSLDIFNCWERRWIDIDGASHTLSATAAIFSSVRTVFSFLRFGLSMKMPVSFTFSKDNEHMELTVIFFFPNPYAIFTHILQHYHDFQSNVTILPSVFQACTQPYSFGGWIKLIIC